MAINAVVNNKVELIAFRAAEASNYLRLGSRKYFKDQLVGKRNGQSFQYVVRDAGEFQEGIDLSGNGPSNLTERKVTKSLQVGNVLIQTNLLNKVTDVNWDDEIAKINGPKLVHGVVRKAVDADLGLQNTAFVGTGFQPLFKAQNFLKTVSDAQSYGFINPLINSVLSSNGQSFQPAEASDVFSGAGLVGKLADVEYRANQFMPMVSVDSALDTEIKKVTGLTYADAGDGVNATLTLSGVNAVIPKGYVLWIRGLYATDICGDKTAALKAFIAYEDGTTDGTDAVMKIRKVNFAGEGTKEVCKADGSAYGTTEAAAITAFNSAIAAYTKANIDFLPVGDFFGGFVRIDGAMEFESISELDASNADTKKETVEGITVIENRAVDVIKGSNDTRWTIVSMSGIVEPREVAYVLVKDQVINEVRTNP
jgi:hypothetical protein